MKLIKTYIFNNTRDKPVEKKEESKNKKTKEKTNNFDSLLQKELKKWR